MVYIAKGKTYRLSKMNNDQPKKSDSWVTGVHFWAEEKPKS